MTISTNDPAIALPEDVSLWTPAQIHKAPEAQMPKFDGVGEWNIKQICAALSRKIPPNKLQTKSKGGATLHFIPWYTACSILERYAPGWEYDIDIIPLPDRVIVKATITIHAKDGAFKRASTGEETLKKMTTKGVLDLDKDGNAKEHPYGSPVTNAEGQALRRAASKFGLGRYLYDK